jgi:hypothetical protein
LLRQPNFAVLTGLAWLAVATVLFLQYWPQTADTLHDTDDAMRLVEMRSWLGSGDLLRGWFDLHLARLQPPLGYDSHWSRLIDAGLAGLMALYGIVSDAAMAERLMRATWPLLWLAPTIAAMAAVAWRLAGRGAASVALLLAMVGVPAYQQFVPGRIDHHNVQIALTLLVTAAMVWSDRKPRLAALAGALSGLALAIGFECVPYLAICGAGLALRFIVARDAAAALRSFGVCFAAGATAAFLVSVGSDHWLRPQCDAIAINNVVAAVCAGLGLALAAHVAPARPAYRVLAVTVAGALAVSVLLVIDPICIHGPFAKVDPGIWPIWHDHVRELQPLLRVFSFNPLTAAGIAAFPAAALVAALILSRHGEHRHDFGFLVAAAVFAAAALTTVAAIRGYSYAIWLGMPLVAAAALRLFAMLRLTSLPARITAGLLLTPMALSTGAIGIAHAAGLDDTDSFARPASRECFRTASYRDLAALPKGLVIGDISYGPFVLALTPHDAMAGPYHRLTIGLIEAHRAMAAPPDEARRTLERLARPGLPTYVVVCGPRPPDGLSSDALNRSLWAKLRHGAVPDWLEPLKGGPAFAVYRVKS